MRRLGLPLEIVQLCQLRQLLYGEVRLNGRLLAAGDGAAISEGNALLIRAEVGAEVILFNPA